MYLPAAPFYLEEVTDWGLAALAQHCTRLRQAHRRLQGCARARGGGGARCVLTYSATGRCRWKTAEAVWSVLPRRRLGLLRCSRVGDAGLSAVAQASASCYCQSGPASQAACPGQAGQAVMQCLMISCRRSCPSSAPPPNRASCPFPPMQLCRQLTSLLLHDCPGISDRALVEVGERCIQLRALDCTVARRSGGLLLVGEEADQAS